MPTSMSKRSVTIKTIADDLGLSPSTISRALRGEEPVSEKTIKLVHEAAKRLGYRRDLRAVNLRTGKTNVIFAIITARTLDEYGDPSAMMMIQGLIEGVARTDKTVILLPSSSYDTQLDVIRDAVEGNRCDGIILDHTMPQDARVKYLLEKEFPFVTFGRTELFTPHAFVDIDNHHASKTATKEMISRGFKRIALLTPPPIYLFSSHFSTGYKLALDEHQIAIDPELIVQVQLDTKTTTEMVNKLMSLDNPPDAFVFPNEVVAIAAIEACDRLGLDIAKLGFISRDGTHLFDYFRPAVSSCYFSSLDAGKELSKVMLKLLKGEPVESLQFVEKAVLLAR